MIDYIVQNALRNEKRSPTDYECYGVTFCGLCHAPKSKTIELQDESGEKIKRRVPIMCRCEIEREKREQERAKKQEAEIRLDNLRRAIGADTHLKMATFSIDEVPNGKISRTCRKYVNGWYEMRRDNMGILFFGSKGTGKTFYAQCIASELDKRGAMTAFTTTVSLMNEITNEWDKSSIIRALCRFDLLVLDDLGAERDTHYGAETIYSVIDARYRAKKPTIVTTNLDLEDMRHEPDIWRSRIYDRVIEMCPIAIRMEGDSRREKIADVRRDKARAFLSATGA